MTFTAQVKSRSQNQNNIGNGTAQQNGNGNRNDAFGKKINGYILFFFPSEIVALEQDSDDSSKRTIYLLAQSLSSPVHVATFVKSSTFSKEEKVYNLKLEVPPLYSFSDPFKDFPDDKPSEKFRIAPRDKISQAIFIIGAALIPLGGRTRDGATWTKFGGNLIYIGESYNDKFVQRMSFPA